MARFRTLLKNWKLTGIAVVSLAIALALAVVGTAISNWILLLPPAAADPQRLVTVYHRSPEHPAETISYLDYKEYRDNNHVFSGLAAFPTMVSKFWMEDRGEVLGENVSDNYFSVMGIKPVLGRLFSSGGDEKRLHEVVITYSCWKRWGADPNIVGKTLPFNDGVTIVGVAPKEFTGVILGLSADVISLVSSPNMNQDRLARRDARSFTLIGRLKPGVGRRQASAEIQTIAQRLASTYPLTNKGRIPVLTRAMAVSPDAVRDAELIASVLMLLVLLVLLVACSNAANLLLALAVKRRQETVIKAAVGATRRRLIFEFLSESAALCVLAGLVGFPIAAIALRRMSDFSAMLPLIGNLNITGNVRPDTTVAMIAAVLVLIASLATGLAPALNASSPNLASVLRGAGFSLRRTSVRPFVIIQVSICTFVLVGLGLCLRSVQNLRHIDPGFSGRNVLGAMVIDGGHEKRSEANQKQLYKSLKSAASQISGVQSVSLVNGLPFAGGFNTTPIEVPRQSKTIDVSSAVVDESYFSTLAVPIFSGRPFDSTDRENGPESVIVNRKLAETLWPNQDALGKTMRIGKPPRQVRIVGIAGNGKYNDLEEPTRPFVYYAFSQHSVPQIQIVIRTQGDPRLWSEPLSRAARSVGMAVPLPPFTMDSLLYLEMLVPMLTLYSVGGLGALGLLLAMIGLFGAISYSVGERKRELGIRSALGALPIDLLKLVLRDAGATAGSGIGIGALLGIAATVLLRSQLFGVQAVEWMAILPAMAAVVALTLLVAWVAARPSIHGDPLEAVRHT